MSAIIEAKKLQDHFLDNIEASARKALAHFSHELHVSTSELQSKTSWGLITGSGLNSVTNGLTELASIAYSELPCLFECTAYSHQGKLKLYQFNESYLLTFHGRFHLYEGRSALEVSTPVYLAKLFGIDNLVITNAAGGLNPEYSPGSLMLIEDHINFTGHNPLIGQNFAESLDWGERFPDMSRAYDSSLRSWAATILKQHKLELQQGVYVGVTGPSLETSAERRFFKSAGADAVGMSTVLENIAANHCGIKVLGISAITNGATGDANQQVDTIESVLEQAEMCSRKINIVLRELSKVTEAL